MSKLTELITAKPNFRFADGLVFFFLGDAERAMPIAVFRQWCVGANAALEQWDAGHAVVPIRARE